MPSNFVAALVRLEELVHCLDVALAIPHDSGDVLAVGRTRWQRLVHRNGLADDNGNWQLPWHEWKEFVFTPGDRYAYAVLFHPIKARLQHKI
jgi:hypothetical protein